MPEYVIKQRRRGSGIVVEGISGEVFNRGAALYMNNADGLWYLADADAAATMPMIGVSMERVAAAGQIARIVIVGYVGRGDWAWTRGDPLYVSAAPGVLTQTAPVAPAISQQIGVAITASMIYVNPSGGGAAGLGGMPVYTYLIERSGAAYIVYDNGGNLVNSGANAATMINWAFTTGGVGCRVYLREGTAFATVDSIAFTANEQWLFGGGRSSFIDGDGLATTEHAIVLSGYTDCVISDLSIQTQDGGGKTCHCIFIEDGAHRFHVENVWIEDSDSDGIHFEGTQIDYGYVLNCKIIDVDDNGIYCNMDGGEEAYYTHIVSNSVTSAGADGIHVENFYRGEVTGNVVDNSTGDGIDVGGLNVTVTGNTSGANTLFGIRVTATMSTINGNAVYGNAQHGIGVINSQRNTISDNTCFWSDLDDTGNYDGIYLDGDSVENEVNGNSCYYGHGNGMRIEGEYNNICGNHCHENDTNGMVIANVENVVNGNYCYDNSQDQGGAYHGIYVTAAADRSAITNNFCDSPGDSQEDGIYLVSGAKSILILGNYCYNGMGSGISLADDNDDCHIHGNYCSLNDDYGIEITTANADDNFIGENHLVGNVTGQVLDTGTGTWTSMKELETQVGTIAEPSLTAWTNGHEVDVYNSTEDRSFVWVRVNSAWVGVELL